MVKKPQQFVNFIKLRAVQLVNRWNQNPSLNYNFMFSQQETESRMR